MNVIACTLLVLSVITTPVAGEAFRLGRSVLPTYQEIDLVVDARQTDYTGSVRIDVRVEEAVPTIRLHAEALTITNAALWQGDASTSLSVRPGEHGTIHVGSDRDIQPGEYRLAIDFENDFNTQAVSLYRLEAGRHAYTFTQFEADEAREAFPCWDEPSFKMPFKLSLTLPAEDRAFSNTSIESEEPLPDGLRRVTFRTTETLPVYLVALATGPFEEVPIPGMSVPGRVLCPPGGEADVKEAVRITPPILAALEAYFDWPHPFEKLDLVAVPEFWPGAMENVGLITFREGILVMDPEQSTLGRKRWQAEVIAHELAHQWFGNVVTMEWWDDLWLNEAFADWLAFKVCVDLFPDYGFDTEDVENTESALAVDATRTTRTIRQPVESVSSLLQSADVLAYEKGKAVLKMVEQWMGPEAFRAGVNGYMRRFAWSNARASDLFAALSEHSELEVGAALSTFLDQPGVPHVRAEIAPDGALVLTQERFRNASTELEASANEQTWIVPMRLRYADAEQVYTQSIVLESKRQRVALKTDRPLEWLHLNAGESGYYRWSMPRTLFVALTENAPDVLSRTERVGLTGTIGALLDAGLLGGDDMLALADRLSPERDPEVARSVLDLVGKADEALVSPDLEADFAVYVRRVMRPMLARIGWEAGPDESPAVGSLRASLIGWLADEGRDEEARRYGAELAKRYLEAPDAVDPALVSTALYCSALDGDRALFDTYRERFENATNPAERRYFLGVLGDFRDADIVTEALDYTLEGPLRPQEIGDIPRSIARQSEAMRERVFTWVTEHVDTIMRRIPPPYQVYLPYYGAGCSETLLKRTNAFFGDADRFPPGTEAELAKVNEWVRDCLDLRARERSAVGEYLRSQALTGSNGASAGAPGR